MTIQAPDVPCVPVSTAETPDPHRDLGDNAKYGMALSEQAAIRYLTVHCGWMTIRPGCIARRWKTAQEAA